MRPGKTHLFIRRIGKRSPAWSSAGRLCAGAAWCLPRTNGANEQAVALFLEGKIGFLDIPRLVEAAMDRQAPGVVTLEAVLEADREARAFVAGAAH